MSHTISNYLDAKYKGGGPDSGRFDPVDDEIHASQLSDCERKRKWKHERTMEDEASPYFELGRVFEMMYGAALAYEHDPDVDAAALKDTPTWNVVAGSDRVVQDVNVEIDVGGASIVGEADWVVFTGDAPGVVSEVHVDQDGDRTALLESGECVDYTPAWTEKVVETKTKKDVDWVRSKGPDQKHVYQVYPYMYALDSAGEIAYMQRNDWEEYVVPLDYDPDMWLDCVMRARTHARNQSGDGPTPPPTTPLNDSECKWCKFSHECRNAGGSRWE